MTPSIVIGDGSEMSPPPDYPLFVRVMRFEKPGDQEPSHSHRDGHFTFCLYGRFLIWTGKETTVEVEGPCLVWIAGGVDHQVTALPLSDDERHKLMKIYERGPEEFLRFMQSLTTAACIHDKRAFA